MLIRTKIFKYLNPHNSDEIYVPNIFIFMKSNDYTIDESIEPNSIESVFIKTIKSYEIICSACKKYGIINYTIKDGLVNVDGSVDLSNRNLTEIPVRFGIVNGTFNVVRNDLTSLKNSPYFVKDYFNCGLNQLTDLNDLPNYIGGDLYATANPITDLGKKIELKGYFYVDKIDLPGLVYNDVDTRILNYDAYMLNQERSSKIKSILDSN
jgi:hypothetical protein